MDTTQANTLHHSELDRLLDNITLEVHILHVDRPIRLRRTALYDVVGGVIACLARASVYSNHMLGPI